MYLHQNLLIPKVLILQNNPFHNNVRKLLYTIGLWCIHVSITLILLLVHLGHIIYRF